MASRHSGTHGPVLGQVLGEALLHVLEVAVEGSLRQFPSGVGETNEHRTTVVGIGEGDPDARHRRAGPT